MKRMRNILLGFILLTIVGGFFWWRWAHERALSISPVGGVDQGKFHFSVLPLYLQTDPRWADETIGGSQEPLSTVGCTISSVSMALAHHGITLSPKQLNRQLKAINGYTDKGWVKWNAISEVTEGVIDVAIPSRPSHVAIDEALQAGQPVVTKVLLYKVVPHWVLIVGKSGQEYLIKDPLGNGEGLDKLSKFRSNIYAIRVIKKLKG